MTRLGEARSRGRKKRGVLREVRITGGTNAGRAVDGDHGKLSGALICFQKPSRSVSGAAVGNH